MSKIDVIVGGQFGSEGKGAVAARLAQRAEGPLMAVRVAGPNAGHTVIGRWGINTSHTLAPNLCEPMDIFTAEGAPIKAGDPEYAESFGHADRFAWRLRQVPVAAVVNPTAILAIAAGSEIDPDVLANEVACLDAAGYNVSARLVVDHTVTVIHGRHKAAESSSGLVPGDDSLVARIGSTGKGIGAARQDRLARVDEVCLVNNEQAWEFVHEFASTANVAERIALFLRSFPSGNVQIEGTQGYGLGLHAGFYPFCTSSDCRAIDFLAMAGVNPWQGSYRVRPDLTVWVCLRPYPIRVGGNSGPLRDETNWDELGLPTEHTTVTGKVRRVGAWDSLLAKAAVEANGGPGGVVQIALTMFDSVAPVAAGRTTFEGLDPDAASDAMVLIRRYEADCGQQVRLLGTGPDTMIDLDALTPSAMIAREVAGIVGK